MIVEKMQKRGNTLKLTILTGRLNTFGQKHYIALATQRSNHKKLKHLFGKTVEVAEKGGIVSGLRLPGEEVWCEV